MELELPPDNLVDDERLRESVRDMFRNAQWVLRFTFRENDYQQSMELECRDTRPCLKMQPSLMILDRPVASLELPHIVVSTTPVVALQDAKVDNQLGVISVGHVDASFVRALGRFNTIELSDDEAVQRDHSAQSAMRVKKSADCVLSDQTTVARVKLRMAGGSLAVNWMLRARPDEVLQVVLAQTEALDEWNVLWHVPIAEKDAPSMKDYFSRWAASESKAKTQLEFAYDQEWTPLKRIGHLRDMMPEQVRQSQAWTSSQSTVSHQKTRRRKKRSSAWHIAQGRSCCDIAHLLIFLDYLRGSNVLIAVSVDVV